MTGHRKFSDIKAWDVVWGGADPLPNEQPLPFEETPGRKWKFTITGVVTQEVADAAESLPPGLRATYLVSESGHPPFFDFEDDV